MGKLILILKDQNFLNIIFEAFRTKKTTTKVEGAEHLKSLGNDE